ncbi:MAG: hypothetical protein ACTS3T_07300 [Almyronema sp.]
MTFDAETLYNLLPALYRIRDQGQGEPLKALIQVLAREIAVLEADLDQLYADQFIETCAEWVVPYIGDLIGDRPLYSDLPRFPSARAAVANTLGYRRRKGTATMLEQLARDVTGWPTRVVEFFERLATTQYLNHLRPHNLAMADLRHWQPLAYLDSPFATSAHTAEMRRIPPQRGRYNIANIGLYLWRLEPYTLGLFPSAARAVADPADGRYTFHPVGLSVPLFNPPLPEAAFTLAAPINVPEPLRRRVLYQELESWRQAIANQQPFQPVYFQQTAATPTATGARQRVFDIFVDGATDPIAPPEILICNLADWRRPPASKAYQPMLDPDQAPVSLPIQVAVDPLLGRIAFPAGRVPAQVTVRYTYGFSADVGGGPYDRSESVLPLLARPVTWQIGVSQTAAAAANLVTSLSAAIAQWNSQPAGSFGIIALLDSQTYTETWPTIAIPAGSQLLVVAADWPLESQAATAERSLGQVAPEFLRPHLVGKLSVVGTAPPGSDTPGNLYLNGLLVEGALTVQSGNLAQLQLDHCTLVPFSRSLPVADSLVVEASNPLLHLRLNHTLTGPIQIAEPIAQLQLVTCLVDGADTKAIAAASTPLAIQTSTLLGTTTGRSLEASNSLFTQVVTVQRRQQGCVRFSSLPLASQVPRRYRCQPTLALAALAKTLNLPTISDPLQQAQIERQLSPHFSSKRYGDAAYGQLSQHCAIELRQGADDEAEMGVFHDLYQPQRETNLRVRLEEYLRFSLEAGIFYVT